MPENPTSGGRWVRDPKTGAVQRLTEEDQPASNVPASEGPDAAPHTKRAKPTEEVT